MRAARSPELAAALGKFAMTLPPLPADRPVLAFYGDDFTGSGAVMEVLTFAGLPTVLFLEPPTPELLARFPGARAVGLAGDARTRSPDWMRAELPAIFAGLRALGAPILHYKICSTLDSAPHIGSIGVAAEIGLADGGIAPLVVAAPQIGRWQAFGTLFARAGDGIHRLDRHPTMAVHPVTPMDEADVCRHLARQTALGLGLIDLVDLKAGRGPARLAEERARGTRIVALDVVDDETLAAAGALIWTERPGFVIGSQGVEYALVAAWRAAGLLAAAAEPPKPLAAGRAARRRLRLLLADHRHADRRAPKPPASRSSTSTPTTPTGPPPPTGRSPRSPQRPLAARRHRPRRQRPRRWPTARPSAPASDGCSTASSARPASPAPSSPAATPRATPPAPSASSR